MAAGPLLADRDVYAEAEARLRRPLTAAERRIDIVGADRDLARGKARLAAAIETEIRRVIHAILVAQVGARLRVTDEMTAALLWLHDRGASHARAEIRRAGVEPRSAYAERILPDRIETLRLRTLALLGGIQLRIESEAAAVEAEDAVEPVGGLARSSIAAGLAREFPGAMDAASRLVSSAFASGLGDVFNANRDIFTSWAYSAVMDNNTCDVCETLDGSEYETLEAALGDLPEYGPNPDCLGDGRCRCRLVPQIGPR